MINPSHKENPELELYEGIQGELSIMLAPGRTVSHGVGPQDGKLGDTRVPVVTTTRTTR